VEAAGIPDSIEVAGDPHALTGGVQLTVFRVAQEALTNTLKHAARPTTAHVSLRCGDGRVELEVTDRPARGGGSAGAVEAAAGWARSDPMPAGGRGLRGMRERAAAYGGRLDAGPAADGGWRVWLAIAAEVQEPVR
jgi:signal transduction histidine kinase